MHSAMHLWQAEGVGKLESPSRVQAVVDGIIKNRRLTISDRKDGVAYLIDTGADISVIPRRMVKGALIHTDFQLFAANNTVINTYGNRTRTLDLGLRRPFRWQFVVADVTQPIIGADFLAHHGILPDLKNRRLVDERTLLSTEARLTTGKSQRLTKNVRLGNSYANTLKSPDLRRLRRPYTR